MQHNEKQASLPTSFESVAGYKFCISFYFLITTVVACEDTKSFFFWFLITLNWAWKTSFVIFKNLFHRKKSFFLSLFKHKEKKCILGLWMEILLCDKF